MLQLMMLHLFWKQIFLAVSHQLLVNFVLVSLYCPTVVFIIQIFGTCEASNKKTHSKMSDKTLMISH